MADPNPITPQTFRPIPKVDAQRIIDAIDNAGGEYTTPAYGQGLFAGISTAPNGVRTVVADFYLAPTREDSRFMFAGHAGGQCVSGLTLEVALIVDGVLQSPFFGRTSGSPGDLIDASIAGVILSGDVGVTKHFQLAVLPGGADLQLNNSAQIVVWEVGGVEPTPPPPPPPVP